MASWGPTVRVSRRSSRSSPATRSPSEGDGGDAEAPEAGRLEAGPLPVRAHAHPRSGHDGQPRRVGSDGREGAHPRRRGPGVRRRPVRRGRGPDPPPRRLHPGVPGRRGAGRARHPDRGPPPAAVDALGRLQAARAARPGAGRGPGRAAARRADEPPRHPLHPLAGEVPGGDVQGDGDRDLPRPPLPRQHLHPHRGRGLRDDDPLPRQLQRLPRRQGGRTGTARKRRSRSARRRSPSTRSSSTASGPRPPRPGRRRARSR